MTSTIIECNNCGQENKCDLTKGPGIFKCGRCGENIHSTKTNTESSCISINKDLTQSNLDRIRPKLLDLSKRNRLLNFRETSLSILIVNEHPSQVFNNLVNIGNEMTLLPEQESLFEGIQEGSEPVKKYSQSPVNNSYTLTDEKESTDETDGKNFDRNLQTKINPEQLETKLRRLSSTARTIIEETGTNQLYLSLGFLQWRESQFSEGIYTAPLILVPIELNKCVRIDAKTRTFRYEIKYTDEDLITNITLSEKLKQDFGVLLPEFDETKDPEEYFQEVEAAIAEHKQWFVKRDVLVGFFTFSKLLMYLDLDPNNWPDDKSILDHPQINLVSNGFPLGDSDLLSEHDVENDQLAQSLHLVLDADSSQHAVITEVIKGKSLVIEGPPGTGKSQTITNIIAAALHSGKSVLFAAEKLAALEVVRRNLNKVGLGDFCLELHSYKAQKKKILDDLNRRLNRKNSTVTDLDYEINRLKNLREELHSYVELVSSAAGPKNETIFDILWKSEYYRTKFGSNPKFNIKNADSLNQAEIESYINILEEIASFIDNGSLDQKFIWNGIRLQNLHYGDESELEFLIKSISEKSKNITETISNLLDDPTINIQEKFFNVTELNTLTRLDIDQFPKNILSYPLRNTKPEKLATARLLVQKLNESGLKYLANITLAKEHVDIDKVELEESIQKFLAACLELEKLGFLELPLLDIKNICQVLGGVIADVKILLTYFEKFSVYGVSRPRIVDDLKKICNIHTCLKEMPEIKHPETIPFLLPTSTLQILNELQEESSCLIQKQSDLKLFFSLPDLPSRDELGQIRRILRLKLGKVFSIFSSDYRKAKKSLSLFLKDESLIKNKKIIAQLEILDGYLEKQNVFLNNQDRLIFGSYYKNHDTNWGELKTLTFWAQKVFDAAGSEASTILLSKINRKESAALLNDSTITVVSERLVSNINRLTELNFKHTSFAIPFVNTYIADFLQSIPQIVEVLTSAYHTISFVSQSEFTKISDIKKSLMSLHEALNLKLSVEKDGGLVNLFGEDFNGVSTDIAAALNTLEVIDLLSKSNIPEIFLSSIIETDYQKKLQVIKIFCAKYKAQFDDLLADFKKLNSFGHLDLEQFLGSTLETSTIEKITDQFSQLQSHMHSALTWADYCRSTNKAQEVGLTNIVELLETKEINSQDAREHYLFSFYHSLSQMLLKKNPLLYDFTRSKHEELRKRFAKLDRDILDLSQRKIASVASQKLPPNGISFGPIKNWTELALIKHEIGKSRRHIAIRKLVEKSGCALQAIKPCFMMSPMSVAQYLPRAQMEFDILIMDEASQVRPHEALGAIARAKQIVIVGDPKQLPPTTFFDNIGDDANTSDEDWSLLEESDSILDVCLAANIPPKRLRWHYRSEHESLIAFSNSQFYDNDLVIFPSSDGSKTRLGLVYRYISDSTYSNSRNLKEAQTVAKAIAEHARLYPEYSLGVGTFNVQQKELIEDCLEQLKKDDSSLERAINKLNQAHDSNEPLIIKNLENFQGDQRDIIFISCTYGPDAETGKVMNRFGPINGKYGWRRLNVMFSRAKRRMEIFTSMQPEDIIVGPESSLGVNSLKRFLEYARSGIIPDSGIVSDRLPDSDFEISVGKILQQYGYKVTPQVGVAGYFIDMAVNHPHSPGEYLVGIECDGATYHSSRSARDRDRLREEVLKKRGWELYRIWSTDWFKNREIEIQRLIKYLQLQSEKHSVTV